MNVADLKRTLSQYPAANIRFLLPKGEAVPAHAHVTEVARIDKRFIDCGGNLHHDSRCRLQTWFANDVEHRLTAGKLAKILEKAASVLGSDELDVDVEYEVGVITQAQLESVEVLAGELAFHLGERHTACLAMDKCLPKPSVVSEFNPLRYDFREPQRSSKCCA